MKSTIVIALLLCVTAGYGQPVEISVKPTGKTYSARLDWPSVPGKTYSVHTTTSLQPSLWTNATPGGLTISNVLGSFESPATNRTKFFKVVKEDTDPPSVENLLPSDGAIAVVSNAATSFLLSDETGIATNSLIVNIGPWTNLTLAGGGLIFSTNGNVTFNPTGILGAGGAVITNTLTVSDILGHTLSNYTWTFQLARPTVATNAFLSLTAPMGGSGMLKMSDGTTRMRSLPGVRPQAGTDEHHIIAVTSDTLLFSYSGTPPVIANGTRLVSFDAAYPFYRAVISNTIDQSLMQIMAWTTNIPLTELVSEGSLSSVSFAPAEPIQGAAAAGIRNFNLPVAFGSDLSGTVLYEGGGLKLHLPAASWNFTGDVAVDLDINWGQLHSLDAMATGKLTLNLTPEAIFSQAISGSGEKPLIQPITKLFGGMAGPVPVWVEVTMELNGGYTCSANAAGSANATLSTMNEVTFEVQLRDNQWTHDFKKGVTWHADPIEWQLEGAANAKVYVQPKLTVLVYSLAGLWADIKPYAELAGKYQANPLECDLALYYGLSSTLGVESRIPGIPPGIPTPEWPLFNQKWPLWSTNYPTDREPAFIAGFPNQTVVRGGSLTLVGYAAGDPTPGYKWYFNGFKISGATGAVYSISPAEKGHQGDYSVQADNTVGSVQTSCYVTVSSGICPSGMVMIPAGNNSGSNPLGEGEVYHPPVEYTQYYSLTVSAFYMDRTEVTAAQWDDVYNWAITHGYTFDNAGGYGKAADHPVAFVNWYTCVEWCNARSEKEGRPVSYRVGGSVFRGGPGNTVTCDLTAAGYRLPTAVEWEYAARGGVSSKRFPWGDTIDHNKANYYGQAGFTYDTGYPGYDTRYNDGWFPFTSPVGSFGANGYGLYDMAGNVSEWCQDWWPGLEGYRREVRGGNWYNACSLCRVGQHYAYAPDFDGAGLYTIGFRAVLPPGQQ